MKQFRINLFKPFITLIILLLGLSMSTISTAEEANNNMTPHASTNQLLWALSNYISHAVEAAVKTQQNLLYAATPGLQNTMTLGASTNASQSETHQIANQDLLSSLKIFVTTSDRTDIIDKAAKQVPISNNTVKKFGKGFNLNSFIQTPSLSSTQANFAKNYIAFAGGLVKPHEIIEPRDILSDTQGVSAYKVQLGIAAARAMSALSTLDFLLAERTQRDYPNDSSGVTINSSGNVDFNSTTIAASTSPLMIDKYNAEKRAANPSWYTAMEAASPATLQREQLYVMANLQQSLFQMRMLMERQTALLALISLQQSEVHQKAALDSDAEDIARAKSVSGRAPSVLKQKVE